MKKFLQVVAFGICTGVLTMAALDFLFPQAYEVHVDEKTGETVIHVNEDVLKKQQENQRIEQLEAQIQILQEQNKSNW